jgi:hypothetical protein
MEKLYNNICHYIGLRLFTLGAQLSGFQVFCMYQPEGDPFVRAMHAATDPTQLNNSMRTYVDDLDATYEL